MTVLSDVVVREMFSAGQIKISPKPEDRAIQSCSVELHLDNDFCLPVKGGPVDIANLKQLKEPVFEPVFTTDKLILQPGQFILGSTKEVVVLGDSVCANVNGKSTFGRCGLQVHATAGFIDPGFDGNITLELYNQFPVPLILREGMPICQLVFYGLYRAAERTYGSKQLGSHYKGQRGVTGPRG